MKTGFYFIFICAAVVFLQSCQVPIKQSKFSFEDDFEDHGQWLNYWTTPLGAKGWQVEEIDGNHVMTSNSQENVISYLHLFDRNPVFASEFKINAVFIAIV